MSCVFLACVFIAFTSVTIATNYNEESIQERKKRFEPITTAAAIAGAAVALDQLPVISISSIFGQSKGSVWAEVQDPDGSWARVNFNYAMSTYQKWFSITYITTVSEVTTQRGASSPRVSGICESKNLAMTSYFASIGLADRPKRLHC